MVRHLSLKNAMNVFKDKLYKTCLLNISCNFHGLFYSAVCILAYSVESYNGG
jgi:hypothetical protein